MSNLKTELVFTMISGKEYRVATSKHTISFVDGEGQELEIVLDSNKILLGHLGFNDDYQNNIIDSITGAQKSFTYLKIDYQVFLNIDQIESFTFDFYINKYNGSDVDLHFKMFFEDINDTLESHGTVMLPDVLLYKVEDERFAITSSPEGFLINMSPWTPDGLEVLQRNITGDLLSTLVPNIDPESIEDLYIIIGLDRKESDVFKLRDTKTVHTIGQNDKRHTAWVKQYMSTSC